MMKYKLFTILLMTTISGQGQNWNEFFRQKRTQIRYLWQQIAALQVYIELGQKGYGIYRDGLTFIGDIKNGEFNLHKNYFASLDAVNPLIAGIPEINEVLQWHEQVIVFNQTIIQQHVGAEQSSLVKVFIGIIASSKNNLHQLELLVNDGHYQLKDEERLSQIKKLCHEQRELYQFARSVYLDVFGLHLQQNKEQKDSKLINSFHGLK